MLTSIRATQIGALRNWHAALTLRNAAGTLLDAVLPGAGFTHRARSADRISSGIIVIIVLDLSDTLYEEI